VAAEGAPDDPADLPKEDHRERLPPASCLEYYTTMAAPDRTHHATPRIDEESALVLADAVASLGTLRGQSWLGDAGVELHLRASLHRQVRTRLPDAVAEARDQDYSWAEIGDLLGTTRAAAWQRYGRPGKHGNPRPVTD